MHSHSYLGPIALLTTIVSALPEKEILVPILPRQSSEEDYLSSVCSPNITSGTIPPCIEVITIQSACTPNGTTPLDYLAHAQSVVSAFNTIITSASNQLCTGTPTASFAAIFNSLGGGDVAEGTATQLTDLYPSETAVSLYYTASGNQGVGAITGSATGATKTGSTSASVTATGSSSASGVSATATKTSAGSAGTTTSGTGTGTGSTSGSTGGAAPTGVMRRFLGMAVGGVVIAAL
ncbi:hypothetical protein H4I95_09388 [Botrytis cinerea]